MLIVGGGPPPCPYVHRIRIPRIFFLSRFRRVSVGPFQVPTAQLQNLLILFVYRGSVSLAAGKRGIKRKLSTAKFIRFFFALRLKETSYYNINL
jgi:hypothetical protein